ncbi:hypothetical protein HZS_657 [Henneguya salminicola]|nr:hypothetical protein HZS_657 [Henneguya salminicola]
MAQSLFECGRPPFPTYILLNFLKKQQSMPDAKSDRTVYESTDNITRRVTNQQINTRQSNLILLKKI